jgi:vacuolar-type H+-ATPase subunit I/STV1
MDQQEHDAMEKDAKRLGEYIALLLEAADIPEQEKIAFAALIPEMEPEQLDRLIAMLEANIQDNNMEIEGLKEKLEAVNEKYAAQEQAVVDETMKSLEEIEQFIKDQEPKV